MSNEFQGADIAHLLQYDVAWTFLPLPSLLLGTHQFTWDLPILCSVILAVGACFRELQYFRIVVWARWLLEISINWHTHGLNHRAQNWYKPWKLTVQKQKTDTEVIGEREEDISHHIIRRMIASYVFTNDVWNDIQFFVTISSVVRVVQFSGRIYLAIVNNNNNNKTQE